MCAQNQADLKKTIEAFLAVFRQMKKKLTYNNPLFSLPLAQMETLKFIHEKKLVMMNQVAKHFTITPPSATALVNNLVKVGYVNRIADKKDRRVIHLKLSDQGNKILQKAFKQHCQRLSNALSKLNQTEQIQFLKLLRKMSN